jgi:ABC-type nitrate/sulfonate/bicarbonate transport system substrate-binding protein
LEPYVDVQLLPVGENVPAIMQAFENGQIAAYSSSWNRNISFLAAGFDLVDLTPEAFQLLPAEDVVVPASLAANEPALVAGICRAVAKGMLVGLENPAAALAIMQKVSPEEHSDLAYIWLYMEGAQETVRPPKQGDKYYFGIFDFEQWQAFADLAGEKPFDLAQFLTNDFVPEMNNFDYQGVIDQAAAYAAANPYPAKPQ